MKGKDKGFSLVELIVVIAIMAVALTVGGFALSAISLTNAKECATEIKSTLEAARVDTCRTVSGSEMKISLSRDAQGTIKLTTSTGTTKEIGGSGVAVKYRYKDGAGYTEYASLGTTPVIFQFDRSTGAFKGTVCCDMIVSSGGREYTLTFYSKTGKVTME